MKKTIFDFEKKYEVQDELLNEGALEGLDERTLHETIKAMLINTIKDCIKYETYMDPDMDTIRNLLIKENKTEEMKMNRGQKEEQVYTLKVEYDSNKNSIGDIIQDIQIKVHSEQLKI